MKQIILIRHAKVDIDNSECMKSSALKAWVEAYDNANIDKENRPSEITINAVKHANLVLTSTLKRTIDSAKVLGVESYEQNAIFNEASIPDANIPFFKFKPNAWLVILRVLSLFRMGKISNSLKVSKQQAKEAKERLRLLSEGHDTVVLVGHGGMNWLIRKALMKEGWILEPNASSENWGLTVLKLEETSELF